jgi:biotin operon repressor
MNVVNLSSKLKQNQPQDHRRSIAKQKFAWIDRILLDRTVPHLAFRLAVLIGSYLNSTSGDAWPSQARLAADLGLGRRTIQYALDALVAAGYLAVEVSKGRGHTNHYRPIFETEKAHAGAHIDGLKCAPDCVITPSKMRNLTQENAQSDDNKMRTAIRTELSLRRTLSKIKNLPAIERKNLPAITDKSDFAEWYQQYPKRVGQLKAEAEYAKAIKKGATHEELLAGAIRYAGEKIGQDPKFTKYPAKWLSDGCWMDEPQRPSKPTGRDAIMAGLQSFLQEQ